MAKGPEFEGPSLIPLQNVDTEVVDFCGALGAESGPQQVSKVATKCSKKIAETGTQCDESPCVVCPSCCCKFVSGHTGQQNKRDNSPECAQTYAETVSKLTLSKLK